MTVFYFKPKLGFPEWENKLAVDWLMKNEGLKCWAELGRETGVRTGPQNNALHLFYSQLAKELNASGLTVQKVLEKTVDIDWSEKRVKELLWRPIQEAVVDKTSTTQLDKVSEIDLVYEHVNRFVAEFGVHIPFPSQATK